MPADSYTAMLEAALVNGFRQSAKDDPSFEAEYPGISAELEQAMVKAARPLFIATHRDSVLTYARFYSRMMTTAEVNELDIFYRSRVGQKMIAAKYGHVSSPAFAASIDPQQTTTRADIDQANRGVAKVFVGDMTQADMREMTSLLRPPLIARMKALRVHVARLDAEEANRADPALDLAISTAVEAIIKRRSQRR